MLRSFMMPQTASIGAQGEQAACVYLAELGYDVRARNVRLGKDEIDIIAYDRRRKMMVFVEVKTRSTVYPAYPVRTAVDQRKRRCLKRAIARWVTKNRYEGPGRIDIVCMSDGQVIEHIMDMGSDFW